MTETGQVVYKSEKQACRAFPDQQGDGIASGPQRNFQIFSPLDFLPPPPPQTGHAPPDGDGLVPELDSPFSDPPIGSPDQADQSQELTYVDIDTLLATL